MSASDGHKGDSHAHGSHDAHGHGHTPPAPPEPRTPMWLPALGAVLFLAVGLAWGLSGPSASSDASKVAPKASATALAAPDAGAARPTLPAGHP